MWKKLVQYDSSNRSDSNLSLSMTTEWGKAFDKGSKAYVKALNNAGLPSYLSGPLLLSQNTWRESLHVVLISLSLSEHQINFSVPRNIYFKVLHLPQAKAHANGCILVFGWKSAVICNQQCQSNINLMLLASLSSTSQEIHFENTAAFTPKQPKYISWRQQLIALEEMKYETASGKLACLSHSASPVCQWMRHTTGPKWDHNKVLLPSYLLDKNSEKNKMTDFEEPNIGATYISFASVGMHQHSPDVTASPTTTIHALKYTLGEQVSTRARTQFAGFFSWKCI